MVHHEGMPIPKVSAPAVEAPVPAPRMTMEERWAKRLAEQTQEEAVPSSPAPKPTGPISYEQWKAKRAAEISATSAPAAESASAIETAPAAPEAAVEVSAEAQEKKTEDEKAERAKLMYEVAKRKHEQAVRDHQDAQKVRERLQQLPSLPRPATMPRVVERPPEPMPKVDQQKVYNIPGFGPAMILTVDENTRTMYFATPEERRKVDAMMVKDEGMSSRDALDHTNKDILPLTPDQVRQFLVMQPQEGAPAPMAEKAPVDHAQHLQNRYAAAA